MSDADFFQIIRLGDDSAFQAGIDGADLKRVDEDSRTMLHEAIVHGREAFALELMRRGVNVCQQGGDGQTPLHFASLYRQSKVLREVLARGADVSLQDRYGNEALWTAVSNARGEYDCVRLLMEAGANPNHKNKAGRSPLDFALRIKDEELVRLLQDGPWQSATAAR